jgi:hypothetical protein
MQECEEPNCREPATKDWEGRKVCADHHDMYRDKLFRLLEGGINSQ